ncbi:C39 family peptidase [Nonomuraea zeae]|uniref:C39 family peptidase n=1 Tax=Nonomuraea zeae TaxID=1642303 RepID=UPI0014792554|nr:C39 family peptidase [Nonomuraea zeae]
MRSARLVLGAALAAGVLSTAALPAAAAQAAIPAPVSAGPAGLPVPPGRATVTIKGQAQQTGYYCAPAAGSILLRAFGISRSQARLAKEMRTDAEAGATKRPNTLAVLNAYVGPKGYGFRLTYAKDDPAALMYRVSQAVGVHKRPTIVAVLGNKLPWSKGERDVGHAIVAYGYDRSKGTIAVWDPNGRRGATGKHVISAKALAAVVHDLPADGLGGVFDLYRTL